MIEPNDVSIATRNWHVAAKGPGIAGLGIFVNGNGFTHTVLRISVQAGESVMNGFAQAVEKSLEDFFPGT